MPKQQRIKGVKGGSWSTKEDEALVNHIRIALLNGSGIHAGQQSFVEDPVANPGKRTLYAARTRWTGTLAKIYADSMMHARPKSEVSPSMVGAQAYLKEKQRLEQEAVQQRTANVNPFDAEFKDLSLDQAWQAGMAALKKIRMLEKLNGKDDEELKKLYLDLNTVKTKNFQLTSDLREARAIIASLSAERDQFYNALVDLYKTFNMTMPEHMKIAHNKRPYLFQEEEANTGA